MIDALGRAGDIGFSSPDSDPTDANTANWVEILANWRNIVSGPDFLYFGSYENTWPLLGDLRAAGYSANFGIPGYTASNWDNLLRNPDLLQQTTSSELFNQLASFDFYHDNFGTEFVIVIMLGGNDIKAEYNDIFNDTEPAGYLDALADLIMGIADLLDNGASGQRDIVLCTVPDVGITPTLMATYSDPVRRASTRAKIQAMNDDLKFRAAAAGYAIADIHALTTWMEDEVPIKINGQTFLMAGHPENPPNYLFCKDGFHPGTIAHTVMANEVINAINELLGSSILPLANREVLQLIPGLDPDQPFIDWIATQGVAATGMHDNPDGDPFDNLAEFSFGLSAGTADPGLGHDWSGPSGDRFGILWSLDPAAEGYVTVGAERSPDLSNWTPLDPSAFEDLGSGNWRASIDSDDPAAFLKANVTLAP